MQITTRVTLFGLGLVTLLIGSAPLCLAQPLPPPPQSEILIAQQSPEALFDEAKKKRASRDYQGAIETLNQLLEMEPELSEAYNNRGVSRMELGDLKGALADFNQAIRFGKDYSVAYANRAAIFAMLGEFNIALNDLNRAIQLNQEWGEGSLELAYMKRAKVYLGMGNQPSAIADFKRALQLNPQVQDDYLKQQLQAAVTEKDWKRAIFLVDVIIAVYPQAAPEFTAYRNRLQRILND